MILDNLGVKDECWHELKLLSSGWSLGNGGMAKKMEAPYSLGLTGGLQGRNGRMGNP